MGKYLSRRDFLKGAAAAGAGAAMMGVLHLPVAAEEQAASAGLYTPGTYTASAQGISSAVTVTMTFDESSITDVVVDASGETESIGAAAADELAQAILDAQSAEIDAVSGATITSNAAMEAAANCIAQAKGEASAASEEESTTTTSSARPFGYMCDEDWLGEAPVIDPSEIAETKTFDVVVVGGGHAGTQAALAAAQLGASVAVIENHEDGNITYRGDDICSYNSELLQSWGFGPYDLEEIVNEYVRRANGRCDTDVIRAFVYNSGEMMDNLASLVPDTSDVFDYEGGQCIVQIAYNKPDGSSYPVESEGYKMWASTFQSIGTMNEQPVGKAGLTEVSRLTELETYCRDAAEDLGAEWFCSTEAVVLTQDENGKVTGMIGQDADGNYIEFAANKGVILATGDFGGNVDMVWELCSEVGEYAERVGITRESVGGMTDCTGYGHKMGCWAGGMIETHPRPIAVNCPNLGFGPWGTTPCLWLNCQGKRFMNEAMAGLALVQSLHQPMPTTDSCNFAIMDKNYMEYIQRAGLDHGAPNWGYQEGMDIFETDMEALDPAEGSGTVQGLEIANKTSPMTNTVYVGDTAEEAMRNAGLAEDVIANALESIERYNELCANGDDEDYCKSAECMIAIEEGPFYVALQSTKGLYNCGLNTITGLVVNGDMQVLNSTRDAVIEGLYAVGNCMGQRFGNSYNCPSAGNNMGNAMTTGRVAGKHCASLE
ncbi:MAG: FAD-binding protein [Lachnospiraceae bacterium]|nr:FAD-binding protein [Lachnospiraceae bacterium]